VRHRGGRVGGARHRPPIAHRLRRQREPLCLHLERGPHSLGHRVGERQVERSNCDDERQQTENDKTTDHDARGERIPLRRAKNHLSQVDVPRAILTMVRRRQPVATLSLLGKVATLFPRLSEVLTARQTLKSPMYKRS